MGLLKALKTHKSSIPAQTVLLMSVAVALSVIISPLFVLMLFIFIPIVVIGDNHHDS